MATNPLSFDDVRSGGLPVYSLMTEKHEQKHSIECVGTMDGHPKCRTLLPQVENSKGEKAPAPRKPCMEATTETQAEEQNITLLWKVLQVAEGQRDKRGLKFGQAMYEYREKHSASGRRTDLVSSEARLETFEEFCDRLSIPRATAYRWIAKYEEFIGTRLPKPDPPNRPNETTSYKVETEPTAQASSRVVSSSEDSSSAEFDPPLLELEPEPTPPASTPPPVVTTEKKDLEQLGSLAHRLDSESLALKQVVDAIAKWSKYAEYTQYADVVSAGEKIADFITTIRTFIPDNQKTSFDERLDAK
jgi:hypothetical protein